MHSVPRSSSDRCVVDADVVWKLCERLQALGLDHADLGLIVHLLAFARRTGVFYASVERLARAVGRDRSTISRRLQRLVAAGVLQRVIVPTPGSPTPRVGYDLRPLAAVVGAGAPGSGADDGGPASTVATDPAAARRPTAGADRLAEPPSGSTPADPEEAAAGARGAPPEDREPTESLDRLWRAVLEAARPHVLPAAFDCWLAETRLVQREGRLHRVAVNRPGAKEWLERRFVGLLRRCLAQVVGGPVELEVTAPTQPGLRGQPQQRGPALSREGDDRAALHDRAATQPNGDIENYPPGYGFFEKSSTVPVQRCTPARRRRGVACLPPPGNVVEEVGGGVEVRLRGLMRQLSAELHDDPRSAGASQTRLLRLWQAYDGSLESFVTLVDEARAVSRQARVRLVGRGCGGPDLPNRVPYFFAVLENAIRGRRPARSPSPTPPWRLADGGSSGHASAPGLDDGARRPRGARG